MDLTTFMEDPSNRTCATCLDIAKQITRAIAYLHIRDRPLVHRDIKPQNILILKNSENAKISVKIADFGLSSVIDFNLIPDAAATSHERNRSNVSSIGVHGTLPFMAPEMFAAKEGRGLVNGRFRADVPGDMFALGLVYACGHKTVAVVGHDFGSPIAAWCAVTRPDVFTKVALMSAPFSGTGSIPFNTANEPQEKRPAYNLYEELAKLPRPRKHYQAYYRTREANDNMWHASQGLHAFLRGYYHYKSADWKANKPFRLKSRTAPEMAQMPTYYIMNLEEGMAETVVPHMPSQEEIVSNQWLPNKELQVYTQEYQRTGFQGGLNSYPSGSLGAPEMQLYAGRKIEQPSIFISGASDWGYYQAPGALERMQGEACTDMQAVHLIPGAGHWVQQEQPEKVVELLLGFLKD